MCVMARSWSGISGNIYELLPKEECKKIILTSNPFLADNLLTLKQDYKHVCKTRHCRKFPSAKNL